MKNKISVCVIAKNEEKNIKRCFNSIQNIASEIITLDTGSIDSTRKIAKSYGNVYNYSWKDNFSEARNKCMSYATSDWIMFIDADELLLRESSDNLDNFLDYYKKYDIKAFNFRIINHMKEKIIPEVYRTTIFKNNIGIHFVKPVGEYIALNDGILNIEQTNKISIIHKKETKEEIKKKALYYINIIKNHLNKTNNLHEICTYNVELGDYYCIVENYMMADQYYKKAYSITETMENDVSISFLENLLTRIINNLVFNLRNYSESLEFIKKLRKINDKFYKIPNFIKRYDDKIINVFCLGAYGYNKLYLDKDFSSAQSIYEYVIFFFQNLDNKNFEPYLNYLFDLCSKFIF